MTTLCPVSGCGIVETLDLVDFMEGVESGAIHELHNDIVDGIKNCTQHTEEVLPAKSLPDEYAQRINGTGVIQLAY